MTQAVIIIKRSLQSLGRETVMQPADPSMYESGLMYLKSLIAYFLQQNIRIHQLEADGSETIIRIPNKLTDDLNEPDSCTVDIINCLSIHASPVWRVPIDPAGIMVAQRNTSYMNLAHMFREHEIPDLEPDSLLPYGSGTRISGESQFFRGTLESSPSTPDEDAYQAANNIDEAIEALND